MDISKIMVENVDILAEMEILNGEMRKTSISPTMSEKEVDAYDQGVKNTMIAIESLITHADDEEKDRLIYQKYGEQSDMIKYMTLADVLKELEGQTTVPENINSNEERPYDHVYDMYCDEFDDT